MKPKVEHHYLRIDETRVHYVTAGSGKPLIMVSGWMGSWLTFKDNISELSKHFKIIMLDLPGFGDSEELRNHSLYNTVIFFEKFMEKINVEKPYIIGHSMGGIVAFKYSIRHPDRIEKLILSGTPFYFPLRRNRILTFLFRLLMHERMIWLGEKIKQNKLLSYKFFRILFYDYREDVRWYDELLEMKDKAMVRSLVESGYYIAQINYIHLLKDLHCPTLIIDGEKNPLRQQLERLSKLIPNSQYVVIPETKHCMLMEKPKMFNRIVLQFLK